MQEQVVEANVKSFMDADAMMRDWTQHAVGQYLPSSVVNDQGDREKTAKEVTLDAHREAEAQIAFLSRFWGQFADLISMMQRGLLDPDTNDKAAKELQAELEEAGVTREEMDEFANAPAAEVVQDLTQIQAQMIGLVSNKYVGNPNINQRELMITRHLRHDVPVHSCRTHTAGARHGYQRHRSRQTTDDGDRVDYVTY